MSKTRIVIANDSRSKRSRLVAVEPWGNDYTLLPGEELEVVAESDTDEMPWFIVAESNGDTAVWCEETDVFTVLQGGVELECGHNSGR